MAVPIHVTPIPPFEPHGELSSVAYRWQKWLKSFNLFADAAGCKNDRQKRQLLLHTAGSDVQDIFYTLTETGTDYKTAAEKLSQYFARRKNTSYNRHKFRQEKQKEGETVAQFVKRLRQLAALCDFPDDSVDSVDSFIRDQLIDNCLAKKLLTKLLAERDLNLDRALDIAQAMEASESQSRQIAEDNQFAVYTVGRQTRGRNKAQRQGHNHPQRQRQNQDKPKAKQCTRCGIKGHSGDDCRCSRGVTCHKCGLLGHFASVCRTKTPMVDKLMLILNVDVNSTVKLLAEILYVTSMSTLRNRCVTHAKSSTQTVMMSTQMNMPLLFRTALTPPLSQSTG